MIDNLGLNNRVFQILSQNSQKAAVDILGMRISTKYKNKYNRQVTKDAIVPGAFFTCPIPNNVSSPKLKFLFIFYN